jgi:hypothetical protein
MCWSFGPDSKSLEERADRATSSLDHFFVCYKVGCWNVFDITLALTGLGGGWARVSLGESRKETLLQDSGPFKSCAKSF